MTQDMGRIKMETPRIQITDLRYYGEDSRGGLVCLSLETLETIARSCQSITEYVIRKHQTYPEYIEAIGNFRRNKPKLEYHMPYLERKKVKGRAFSQKQVDELNLEK
jgi:hypothetical protein